ncbi:AFG2-interacting ribosome maturation factor [Excalfactoria chinensis]|uniref:AFG2-interacting ribosome maturation factor n=1 Tax=Excalfactoria chinensis TaxID=46218 RepID=UPI003B3B771E
MTHKTATASGLAAIMAAMVAELREWEAAAGRWDAAWRAAMAACTPLLASLAGLAAQMRATQRLAWGGTPLGAFSELRERLWRKQRGAAEALLEELSERREELRAVRDAVGAGVAAVMRVYEERPAALSLTEVLRRGPSRPSLADVLEGLQDVERYYRYLYLEIKQFLLLISCDSLADMEALPQTWEGILERYGEDTVQDAFLKISLFLDN